MGVHVDPGNVVVAAAVVDDDDDVDEGEAGDNATAGCVSPPAPKMNSPKELIAYEDMSAIAPSELTNS